MKTIASEQHYQRSIVASTTTTNAYIALTTGIPGWWSTLFTGAGDKAGAQFTVRFFDNNFYTMEVAELIPGKKVVWKCVEGNTNKPELRNKREWVGSRLTWTIEPINDHTQVSLLHEGLTPQVDCWDICSNGWNFYILDSLLPFLNGRESQTYRGAA